MRVKSLDLLRVLSAIAVILIHVNAHYFRDRAMVPVLNSYYVVESLINIVTRFSVPVFVMISGAFLINNSVNKEFGLFYKKTSYKIGLPFAVLLIVFTLIAGYQYFGVKGQSLNPIQTLIMGEGYNLWYIYMLAGLYLLTPIIIRIKESISSQTYRRLVVIMLLWACGSQATSSFHLPYDMGVVFAFVAYFVAGNAMFEDARRKPIKKGTLVLYGLLIIMLYIITFVVRYMGVSYYLFNAYTNFFSPTIMLISVLIFKIFVSIDININVSKLSGYMFYVYMFHTIIYKVIFSYFEKWLPQNEICSILLVTVCTFIIALGCSIIYDKVWKLLECKFRIKECWYQLKIWR